MTARRAPLRRARLGRWVAIPLLIATPGVSAAQGPLLEGPFALTLIALAVAALGALAARRLLPGARRMRSARVPVSRLREDAPISPAVLDLLRRGGVAARAPDTPRPAAPSRPRAAAGSAERDVIRRLSRDVYWEQDADGVLTRVDDGPVPSPLQLRLGRHRWDDGALPLDAQRWEGHRARLERHEPFADLAWVWTDPVGRVRVALDSGLPRHDADGRFVGYAGVSRDAGADTVADRARRLATAALLAATEPVLWIEAGSGGWRVVWANAAASTLFDRTDRELRQLPGAAMFGPESDGAAALLEQALLARRECRLHVDLARRYGDTRSVEVRLEPLPGETVMRPCAALLIHDRSAEQARLQQDSRAIERLRVRMRELCAPRSASSRASPASFTTTTRIGSTASVTSTCSGSSARRHA